MASQLIATVATHKRCALHNGIVNDLHDSDPLFVQCGWSNRTGLQVGRIQIDSKTTSDICTRHLAFDYTDDLR